ncbi:DUF4240 domain-containing protein [Urbifossiella limnaea]|uniref:DUF4240 domain-containing protein n=1 Tax=Urbifossiella limnaea TaxID=2528023 RepID=A0A517Y1I6_9BACT|nr:DUF4240 domain-containing protein [Urbifossiella limnaea]QDU23593.1 hypothetical protein ETAA1_55960 [Urbifossiella limnaea]
MTEPEFWAHIHAARPRRYDAEAHADQLAARLAELPEPDILDFVHHWDAASARAYRQDLWGAAYLVNGGCSDDGFQYFRWWLVLQGRAAFDAAIADPDTLAEVLDGETEVEAEVYPGTDAWFLATGRAKDDDGYEAFARALRFRHPHPPAEPPLAAEWDFDDDAEVRRRLPRLAAAYLDGEE